MKHIFIPTTKALQILEDDNILPDGAVELTEAEYTEAVNNMLANKYLYVDSETNKPTIGEPAVPTITWDNIRNIRDQMLTDCDWTQMPDNDLSDDIKLEWVSYRKKLRDITTTYKTPNKVVWPEVPQTS